MSPRSFERPATIALDGPDGERGLALEGLHVPAEGTPDGGAVVAPPHPAYGGSMDSPVVTELAHACARTRLESLRFNWRGVGASGGEVTGDFDVAQADYRAALAFIEDSVQGPVVACGYSFGAATAVRASLGRATVRRMVLVAPPPAMLDDRALASFPGAIFVATGARDAIAPPDELEKRCAALERAEFVVIPDTDHFFMTGLGQLGRAATEWLDSGARR